MIPKILTEATVSAAKGISKVVLGQLLKSLKGENKGKIVPYRSDGNKNIICFIHGFCGNPEETFNPLPDFIVKEKELSGWDIISIGYSTDLMPNIGKGVWASSPDLNKIAGYLETNLDIIFKTYSRVVLIGHSMGGLVIQRAILNIRKINKISHVLLFGTPSGGLKKAWFFRWFKNQIHDMDYEGQFIKGLRKEWNKTFQSGYPFYFRTVAGEMDEFVPIFSSLEPFPEIYRNYTSGNHITMVKPSTIEDTSFQIIKKALAPNSIFPPNDDYSELNNRIGQYHEIVQQSQEHFKKLDLKGLRKYIFALEGIGKIDEAIDTIKNSEIIKTNTDLMGILGGRYKRKYLTETNIDCLNEAIKWYDRALGLSVEKDNHQQIFYHAINLAFLYLMEDDQDLMRVREMAEKALSSCEKNAQGDLWELATMAEANLYLNDFEKSKKFYEDAILKADHSIREISSMMINAIYACNALNKLDWKKKLEDTFSEKIR